MSGFETILYEHRGGVAWVTLNRPRVLNAYNVQMRDDLYETLGLIAADDSVRAIVFRGAGDRAFCAGADLTEFGTAPSQAIARQVRYERDVWARLFWLRVPAIAAVRGFCLGSGLEIALGCDLRLAAPDARFGLPETNLGMIPAAGGTQTMPRAVGRSRALDALLTGRMIEAQEAVRVGLVNRIVSDETLYTEAQRVADSLASLEPRVVQAAKAAVLRGADLPLADALAIEQRLASAIHAEK
ncbi:MAG: enoyl-CoA hydratase/isomerase family protein [Chloroflexi bacterium]|nr:enoyl-CoA hydratase/isomerase family protein [Chloroflexota bacterium]